MYSIWLSPNFKRVIAIEPEQNNFKSLILKLKVLRKKNVKALKVAVSDFCGEAKLYIGKTVFTHSLKQTGIDTCERVKVVDLNTLIEEPIDLIKVDVQGLAFEVVNGASKKMSQIRRWIIELEFDELSRKRKLEELMANYGYGTEWLSPQHLYAH